MTLIGIIYQSPSMSVWINMRDNMNKYLAQVKKVQENEKLFQVRWMVKTKPLLPTHG